MTCTLPMTTNLASFKAFIDAERQKRSLNKSEFAAFLGVSHTTINRLLDASDDSIPARATLEKISAKTGTSMEVLNSLLPATGVGAVFGVAQIDAEARLLLDEISKLSPRERRLAINFVRTLAQSSEE